MKQKTSAIRIAGLLLIIILIAGILVFIFSFFPGWRTSPLAITPAPVTTSTPFEVTPMPEPTTTPVATTTTASALKPVPAGMVCDDQSHAICVGAFNINRTMENPIVVTGTAIAFENQFAWKLLDEKEQTIDQGNIMGETSLDREAGEPAPFNLRVFLTSVPTSATATLVLFEFSAKDGQPVHVLRIPVQLPTQSMPITVYTPNSNASCGTVVKMGFVIPKTKFPMEGTVRALFAHFLSEGTILSSFALLQGGVAQVTMNSLPYNLSDCDKQYMRAQITETLKHFPSVTKVVISPAL